MYTIFFSNYDDKKNPYYGGGGAIAIHEIAKRLAGEFGITVITGKYPGSKNETIDGVKYERIGFEFAGPKFGQLAFQALLPFIMLQKNFDLWIESFTPPFSTGFLPLFTKKPVIGLVHMLAAEDMQRKYKLPFTWVEHLGLKVYRRFLTVSKLCKKQIEKTNSSAQIAVVPNGVNIPKLMESPDETQYITFVGRIEINQKGLDLLLEAFQLLARQTNLKLLIAGSGTKREERKLMDLIAKLNVTDRVVLAGRINEQGKTEIFKNTLCVVMPSRFETFGLLALEAFAHKLPVITFDIKGLQWIPQEAALKVKTQDAGALAEAILAVIHDKNLRLTLAAAGEKVAHAHTWERAAEKYKKFFLFALQQHTGAAKPDSQNSSLFDKIVKQRLPCYFISPHLDDAALSAGDLVSYLSGKTDVTVITVFTKASPGPYSLSVKRFLTLHGYLQAEQMYEDRVAEDKQVFESLKVKLVHLGFTDALWRKKSKQSIVSKVLGKKIAEFNYLYPTYRFHVVSGKINPEDLSLSQDVTKAIFQVTAADKEFVIFCPAGFGGHVDHVLVKTVCQQNFKNVIFWKDIPYQQKTKDQRAYKNHTVLLWQNEPVKKQSLVSVYQSQVKKMFPYGVPLISEAYYIPPNLRI